MFLVNFRAIFNIFQQAKSDFDNGIPKYNALLEVHNEIKDDGILPEKKATEADRQIESLTTRHDELEKHLNEKEDK